MILPYIINVALILTACLAFYKLLLRRETFYKVNRYMLVICLAISFSLPLMQVPQQFSLRKSDNLESLIVNRNESTVQSQQSSVNKSQLQSIPAKQPTNIAQEPTSKSQQTAVKDEKQA